MLGEQHPDTAASLNNLGLLLQAMGEHPAARPYFEQALAIYRAAQNPEMVNHLSWRLGNLYDQLGEYKQAVELIQFCAEHARASGDPEADLISAHLGALKMRARRG